jgi:hypothetical protein
VRKRGRDEAGSSKERQMQPGPRRPLRLVHASGLSEALEDNQEEGLALFRTRAVEGALLEQA